MNLDVFLDEQWSSRDSLTSPDRVNQALSQWDMDASEFLAARQTNALKARLHQYEAHPLFTKAKLHVGMTPRDFINSGALFQPLAAQEIFADEGFSDTWVTKGRIDAYLLSSGTTAAKRKVFPVTTETLLSYRRATNIGAPLQVSFTGTSSHFDLPNLLVTAPPGTEALRGVAVTPMSAYMRSMSDAATPGMAVHHSAFVRSDFSLIPGMKESDVAALNIGSINAMPPYVVAMFETLQEAFGIKSFLDLWPNLKLYQLFGFARAPYLSRLEEAFDGRVSLLESYAASEGIFAGQREKSKLDLQINPYDIFFAFLDNATGVLSLADDVKVGHYYSLIVTSPTGCLAHQIGDVVCITNEKPLRFVFAERNDESLRIGTEIISLSDFNSWLRQAAESIRIKIGAFIVSPNSERTGHSLVVEVASDTKSDQLEALESFLDDAMKRDNTYYRNQRNSGYMKRPVLVSAALGALDKILIRPETRGQGKYKRVYNDREAMEKVLKAVG